MDSLFYRGYFIYFVLMAKPFGLSKGEKLKSRKQIEDLFANGKSFAVFPIRVTYQLLPSETDPGLQIGVTASKRYYKKAVDRNRIKRLLREAYRLQKSELTELMKQNNKKGFVFFMYTDKSIATFELIKAAMNSCLKRLEKKAATNETPT
jgi:ribonuclease P protein component